MNGKLLDDLLGRVFDQVRERQLPEGVDAALYDRWKRDFIFHLTDWMPDIERLRGLFQSPEDYETETASTLIVSFLIHVIPHLNAAGRLLVDEVSDPFQSAKVEHGKEITPSPGPGSEPVFTSAPSEARQGKQTNAPSP
jgi:hypothetical protein